MANRKRTVEIEVVADDRKAQATLRGLGDQAGTTGKRFSDSARMIQAAVGGVAAAAVGSAGWAAPALSVASRRAAFPRPQRPSLAMPRSIDHTGSAGGLRCR